MSSGKLFKFFVMLLSVTVYSQTALGNDGRDSDEVKATLANGAVFTFRGFSEKLDIDYVDADFGVPQSPFAVPTSVEMSMEDEKTIRVFNGTDKVINFEVRISENTGESFFSGLAGIIFSDGSNKPQINPYYATTFKTKDLDLHVSGVANDLNNQVLDKNEISFFALSPGHEFTIQYTRYEVQHDLPTDGFHGNEQYNELAKDDYFLVKLPEQDQFEGQSEMQKLKLEFLEGETLVIPLGHDDMVWLCVENQGLSKTVVKSNFPDNMNFSPPSEGDTLLYKVLKGKIGKEQPEIRYYDVSRVTITSYDADFLIKTAEDTKELTPNTDEVFLQHPCNKILVKAPLKVSVPLDEDEPETVDPTPEEPNDPAEGSTANGSNSFNNIIGSRNPADSYQVGGNGCSLQKGTYTKDGSTGMLALIGMVVALFVIPLRKKNYH